MVAHTPQQTVGGKMQQALVSRELLERTDATRRPNDRDEVARLDLRVDVLVNGIPHVEHALEREAEIVDDERDRARDFVRRGRGRPQRAGGGRLRPRLRGAIAAAGGSPPAQRPMPAADPACGCRAPARASGACR